MTLIRDPGRTYLEELICDVADLEDEREKLLVAEIDLHRRYMALPDGDLREGPLGEQLDAICSRLDEISDDLAHLTNEIEAILDSRGLLAAARQELPL